jgi:predicted nucleic acid-binding protein
MMRKVVNNLALRHDYVLDSYALLAYLENETGSDRVKGLLEDAKVRKTRTYMCTVNLGEVMYIIERERGLRKAQETLALINVLPVEIIAADRDLTLTAAHLKAKSPVAYADCFAAALALNKDATIVTGDPEFRKIQSETNIRIEWLA